MVMFTSLTGGKHALLDGLEIKTFDSQKRRRSNTDVSINNKTDGGAANDLRHA